ncbi:hypothetical protein LOK74_21100 [Brevibacillus humidisoli]|uniref:hypothetical protein n=1 Tax=Brevibacillus humidisoli TaxID=2895522 RepID=UPI001E5E8C66|nr:hypothetical protein [Brevibacillus humidisoli]UFJ40497.1 hypothetical protein LOK74_21100 [Brevibacillus humidisoli]
MRKTISVLSSAALSLSLLFSAQIVLASTDLPVTDLSSQAESTVITDEQKVDLTNLLKDEDRNMSTNAIPPTLQAATYYNFSPRDFSQSVQQTDDGGYVFVGSTTASGSEDILLAKTDASLNLQWAYAIGGTASESGAEVRKTSDGGYIVAGTSSASGSADIYLVKTDAAGAIQWSKTIGGPGKEEAQAMEIGHDGGYIIVGTKESSSNSNDAYMLKVDASGNVQWSKTFGQDMLEDRFYDVSLTPDGGYVAAGYKTVADTPNSQRLYGFMAKVSGTGSQVFAATLDRYASLNGVAASSNGYITTGAIYTETSAGYNIYVARVNTSGSIGWTRQFHVSNGDFANDVILAKDGNFVVTGFTTPAVHQEDLALLKVDPSGNTLWANTFDFGGTGEIGRSVATTSDGGYVVTGSFQMSTSEYDALLVKFSSD